MTPHPRGRRSSSPSRVQRGVGSTGLQGPRGTEPAPRVQPRRPRPASCPPTGKLSARSPLALPTLVPIWFPHWPAWMCTISLMAGADSALRDLALLTAGTTAGQHQAPGTRPSSRPLPPTPGRQDQWLRASPSPAASPPPQRFTAPPSAPPCPGSSVPLPQPQGSRPQRLCPPTVGSLIQGSSSRGRLDAASSQKGELTGDS